MEYDVELEKAIEEVGHMRVFAMARANGWGPYDAPPKWVWWQIVATLREQEHEKKVGLQQHAMKELQRPTLIN